jgi:hypothetical protein
MTSADDELERFAIPSAGTAVRAGRAGRRHRITVTLAAVAVLAVAAVPVLTRPAPPAEVSGPPTATPSTDPNYRPKQQDWHSLTYSRGIMTLVAPDELQFSNPSEDLHVTFHPLTGKLEGCD